MVSIRPEPSVSVRSREHVGGADDGNDADEKRADVNKLVARAAALGITAPPGDAFPCILAGHEHDARLTPTRTKKDDPAGPFTGYWRYRCPGLDGGVGLGELRARIAYDRLAYDDQRHVMPVEACRWLERLDWEARIYQHDDETWALQCDVVAAAGHDCPKHAWRVAADIALFVAFRDRRFPRTEPIVFTDKFAAAYCGLSFDEARDAKKLLEARGVIRRDGKHGRSIRWRLTALDAEETT
jgi:hypothetical protein